MDREGSQARPLGYTQVRMRDAALTAIQEALAHLSETSPAVDDLQCKRLTGDGIRERAMLLAFEHGKVREELQRALLILVAMTEKTPLDLKVIARR